MRPARARARRAGRPRGSFPGPTFRAASVLHSCRSRVPGVHARWLASKLTGRCVRVDRAASMRQARGQPICEITRRVAASRGHSSVTRSAIVPLVVSHRRTSLSYYATVSFTRTVTPS
jgi:hypothetical protein